MRICSLIKVELRDNEPFSPARSNSDKRLAPPDLLRAGFDVKAALLSFQNILIDLQSLKLIDFGLLLRSAQQHLFNVLGALAAMFKTSSQLRLENLALRQQLAVVRRSAPKRLRLTPADRIFWVWLRRVWSDVYVAVHGGTQQLFLRPLDGLEVGTEGAVGPFFSRDGQWVGFFADGELKKVSVNGGAAVTLARAQHNPGGASWSSQGTLAFGGNSGQGLQRSCRWEGRQRKFGECAN